MQLFPSEKREVETWAEQFMSAYKLDKVQVIDINSLFAKLKSNFPNGGFEYRVVPDEEMGGTSARYIPGPLRNVIELSATVYSEAKRGSMAAIAMVLEEIAHFILNHRHLRNHNEKRTAAEKVSANILRDELEAEHFVKWTLGTRETLGLK
jgi:hypothetical protein